MLCNSYVMFVSKCIKVFCYRMRRLNLASACKLHIKLTNVQNQPNKLHTLLKIGKATFGWRNELHFEGGFGGVKLCRMYSSKTSVRPSGVQPEHSVYFTALSSLAACSAAVWLTGAWLHFARSPMAAPSLLRWIWVPTRKNGLFGQCFTTSGIHCEKEHHHYVIASRGKLVKRRDLHVHVHVCDSEYICICMYTVDNLHNMQNWWTVHIHVFVVHTYEHSPPYIHVHQVQHINIGNILYTWRRITLIFVFMRVWLLTD